jgi:hypothetical protein
LNSKSRTTTSPSKPVRKPSQPKQVAAPTRKELIEDLKRVQAAHPDSLIARNLYREHGNYNERVWQEHFSRFSDFRKASGLEEHPAPRTAKVPKPPKVEKPKVSTIPTEADEITGDKRTIRMEKTRIHTLEQLVEHCEIDLDVWEVKNWVCNKWEVAAADKENGKLIGLVVEPLFQIKASLVKREGVEEANRIIERLRVKAEGYAPEYPHIIIPQHNSGNVVEISPVDVHFGAMVWSKETGGDDYDLKIAERDYKAAFTSLMGRTDSYHPEKALLVFGHDQQNADNRAGSTENLTPQNNDGRYQKVADVSLDCTIWAIDACLLHYGKVEIVMVPGNHDPLSTWHLGRTIKAWYRNVPQVNVDNGPDMKKWWEHGVNMLLLTHGNKGKLDNYDKTMAAERPKMWGRTKWREAHTGDKHHRRTIELPGATVRILPSLRPSCAWSAENHLKSIRAAEAYVWSANEGLIGQATHSILQKDDE